MIAKEVAILFAYKDGAYSEVLSAEVWHEQRDARTYCGPYPVVAHPPCNLWTRFAKINYARWGGEHNKPGNDGGCFESALNSIKKWGGVLEHPASTYAWNRYGLHKPKLGRWILHNDIWVTEVWQSAYGHMARKKTWLAYCGFNKPFHLDWRKLDGTHQIGFHDQRGKECNKPTISGKKASATPVKFRDELIKLALNSRVVAA